MVLNRIPAIFPHGASCGYVLRTGHMELVANALGPSIEIQARMLRISIGRMRVRNEELPALQPS